MKEKLKQIVFICCAVGVVVCAILLGITLLLEIKDKQIQQDLLEEIARDEKTQVEAEASDEIETEFKEERYLSKFSGIYGDNQDFAAWICISDTEINYPVMHTPDDPEYYLRRDFNGDYSIAGTIFASYDSSLEPKSDNVILYGHNMKNGSMFADLLKYDSKEYWEEHNSIQLDTLTREQTYEIVYAFSEDIASDQEHFEFYKFIYATNEEEFQNFIDECQELSYYDTGNDPVYGDELLTLVTCSDYATTERMVVVAKLATQ